MARMTTREEIERQKGRAPEGVRSSDRGFETSNPELRENQTRVRDAFATESGPTITQLEGELSKLRKDVDKKKDRPSWGKRLLTILAVAGAVAGAGVVGWQYFGPRITEIWNSIMAIPGIKETADAAAATADAAKDTATTAASDAAKVAAEASGDIGSKLGDLAEETVRSTTDGAAPVPKVDLFE